MKFDWIEYLNLAQELAIITTRGSSREAKQRSSISRAYYAVFNIALHYIQQRGHKQASNIGVHAYVKDYFMNSNVSEERFIGMAIDRMREARVRADYREVFRDIDSKISEVLKDSDFAMVSIQKLTP